MATSAPLTTVISSTNVNLFVLFETRNKRQNEQQEEAEEKKEEMLGKQKWNKSLHFFSPFMLELISQVYCTWFVRRSVVALQNYFLFSFPFVRSLYFEIKTKQTKMTKWWRMNMELSEAEAKENIWRVGWEEGWTRNATRNKELWYHTDGLSKML